MHYARINLGDSPKTPYAICCAVPDGHGKVSTVNFASRAGAAGDGSSIVNAIGEGASNTMTVAIERVHVLEIRVNAMWPALV